MAGVDEKKDGDLDNWLNELYDLNKFTPDDLISMYELYQYQGFNRKEVLQSFKRVVPDISEAIQIIIVCALRGPRRAAETKLRSGKTISSYGIPASGLKGSKGVSCQRITAATADLAAFYLKIMNAPKRLDLPCPAYLQFPSAGSIILPEELRREHIEFSKNFSLVIGGIFNPQIYQQMVSNAYLSKNISTVLFNDIKPLVPSSSSSSSSMTPTPVRTAIATSQAVGQTGQVPKRNG